MDGEGTLLDGRGSALLLVDVINDFEFPDGAALLEHALPAAGAIARLKVEAGRVGAPVIYANDNFGDWRRDFGGLVRHVLEGGVRGEPVARLLRPAEGDHVVLKPMHSAFHLTPLERLLGHLEVERLVIAGFTTDYCVLFTSMDAYMRGFELAIPSDCVAAAHPEHTEEALRYAARALGAEVRPSSGAAADGSRRAG